MMMSAGWCGRLAGCVGVQVYLRGKAHVEWRITRGGERRTVKEDQYFIDEKAVVWGTGMNPPLSLYRGGDFVRGELCPGVRDINDILCQRRPVLYWWESCRLGHRSEPAISRRITVVHAVLLPYSLEQTLTVAINNTRHSSQTCNLKPYPHWRL